MDEIPIELEHKSVTHEHHTDHKETVVASLDVSDPVQAPTERRTTRPARVPFPRRRRRR